MQLAERGQNITSCTPDGFVHHMSKLSLKCPRYDRV